VVDARFDQRPRLGGRRRAVLTFDNEGKGFLPKKPATNFGKTFVKAYMRAHGAKRGHPLPEHYAVALASVCTVVALLAARGCYSPKPAPLSALPHLSSPRLQSHAPA